MLQTSVRMIPTIRRRHRFKAQADFCTTCLAPATHIGTRTRLARSDSNKGVEFLAYRLRAWTSLRSKIPWPWYLGSQRGPSPQAIREKFDPFVGIASGQAGTGSNMRGRCKTCRTEISLSLESMSAAYCWYHSDGGLQHTTALPRCYSTTSSNISRITAHKRPTTTGVGKQNTKQQMFPLIVLILEQCRL